MYLDEHLETSNMSDAHQTCGHIHQLVDVSEMVYWLNPVSHLSISVYSYLLWMEIAAWHCYAIALA